MFNATDPGFLAYMESEGVGDTNGALISSVAQILRDCQNDIISTEDFRSACIAAGVDPDSFTEEDMDELERMLR